MKKSKKFLKVLSATAIAAIMASAMASTSAFAADLDTTTEQRYTLPTSPAGTYSVYKVANATTNGKAYSYTVNSKDLADSKGFETVISNGTDETGTSGVDNRGNLMYNGSVINFVTDSAQAHALAKELEAVVAEETAIQTVETTGTVDERTIELTAGYYLIVSSGVASPILLSVSSNDTYTTTPCVIEAKTLSTSVDKSIESITDANGKGYEGTVSDNKDRGQGAIGATVNYKIEATFPQYAAGVTKFSHQFTITDTPEEGIALNVTGATLTGATVKIGDTDVPAENYTLTYHPAVLATETEPAKGEYFDVVFTDAYVLAHPNETVTITFSGKIDNDATFGTNSNDNNVELTYDNDLSTKGEVDTGDTHKGTATDVVFVYTTKVDVTKTFDGNATDGDKTATFTLYKTNDGFTLGDEVATLTTNTGTDGNVLSFKGLAVGKYILKETSTPDGYKTADVLSFEVKPGSDDTIQNSFDGAFTFNNTKITEITGTGATTINNVPGQTLPGTGGVGTTMFTIGGIALVVVAGGMLTIYMKKRKSSEEE